MRTPLALAVIASVLVATASSVAADLTKVDRTIVKEPTYATKQPKYCLLAFGPEATTRVWLVVDGDFLHVVRDGDETAGGSRVKFPAFAEAREDGFAQQRAAEVDVLQEGKLKHQRLIVTQQRVDAKFPVEEHWQRELLATAKAGDGLVYHLQITLELRPRPGDPIRIAGRIKQYVGMDGNGFLQFADGPKQAPIVHLRGPMRMGLYSPQQLALGAEPGELTTVVGTPGLGKGTFASVPYGGLIAGDAAPVAHIEFPSAKPGEPSIKERYVLPHRC